MLVMNACQVFIGRKVRWKCNVPRNSIILTLSLVLCSAGCGNQEYPVQSARGKVVCNGKPVTSGSVLFTPMGKPNSSETGKPAVATVSSDGTFVLSTFGRFDGAIVGKHSVQYSGSEEEDAEAEPEGDDENIKTAKRPRKKQSAPQCVQNGEIIVEVTASGPNDFMVELTSRRK